MPRLHMSTATRMGAVACVAVGLLACGHHDRQENASSDMPGMHVSRTYVVTPAGDAPAVLYAVIENHTDHDDALVAVQTPAAQRAELHQTMRSDMPHDMHHMDGSMGAMSSTTMMMPADHLSIARDSTLRLAPGNYHVMLLQPSSTLHAGDTVSVTLRFAHAPSIAVHAAVITYADVDTATASTGSSTGSNTVPDTTPRTTHSHSH